MEQSINNRSISHCGVARNGVAMTDEIKWLDEEARKFFTDSEGRVHSVVFTDPDTGERRFGR